MRLRVLATVLIVAALAAPMALASYGVATSAGAPKLRVDATGVAEVSWTAGGARQSFLVPRSGVGRHGMLGGHDVSKARSLALPMAVAVRETPDHTLWALQQVAIAGRPTSLNLARWQGAPTKLTFVDDGTHLTGTTTFHGRPVTGYSSTLAGKRTRIYVYLECFGCPGARLRLEAHARRSAKGGRQLLGRPPAELGRPPLPGDRARPERRRPTRA